ncbi:MAG: response regulator [Candidatus Poseidoniaceae archaeon]|nr:response regulator [Candidatus Poseidoniaceae archaeon]
MKILIFEDSVDIEALLINGGVDVSQMEIKQYWESTDHLNIIDNFKPDVLLLDHYMPPTKGLQVLVNLNKSKVTRPTTIIAISSASMANNSMLHNGADIGINKFDLPQLEMWPHHS